MGNSIVVIGYGEYTLPDELMIVPEDIYDGELYRVTIGRANLTEDELAAYEPLFNAIDKELRQSSFISNIGIQVNNARIIFKLAYVTKNKYSIYEIEATEDDIKYEERIHDENQVITQ